MQVKYSATSAIVNCHASGIPEGDLITFGLNVHFDELMRIWKSEVHVNINLTIMFLPYYSHYDYLRHINNLMTVLTFYFYLCWSNYNALQKTVFWLFL